MTSDLELTRRALHAVAELLLAGPQHATTGEITLTPSPGGFSTTHGRTVRVDGTDVVADNHRESINGRTARDIGTALGVEAAGLSDVYADGSGIGLNEILTVDAVKAALVADTYRIGKEALESFAPSATAILWPEHFDLGIDLDRVNFGVAPGDAHVPEPYAYVGPWDRPLPTDAFWNTSFGSARPLREFADAAAVAAYFAQGRELIAR